jgi:hypothetical protein
MQDLSPTANKDQIIDWLKSYYLKENSGVDVAGELARVEHEHSNNFNFWRDIIFALIKTGEYALHIHDGRWIIYPNPDHDLAKSVKVTNDSVVTTNNRMLGLTVVLALTAIATVIISVLSPAPIDKETKALMREQVQQLRKIQLSLEKLDSSMNRIVPDTSNN